MTEFKYRQPKSIEDDFDLVDLNSALHQREVDRRHAREKYSAKREIKYERKNYREKS